MTSKDEVEARHHHRLRCGQPRHAKTHGNKQTYHPLRGTSGALQTRRCWRIPRTQSRALVEAPRRPCLGGRLETRPCLGGQLETPRIPRTPRPRAAYARSATSASWRCRSAPWRLRAAARELLRGVLVVHENFLAVGKTMASWPEASWRCTRIPWRCTSLFPRRPGGQLETPRTPRSPRRCRRIPRTPRIPRRCRRIPRRLQERSEDSEESEAF